MVAGASMGAALAIGSVISTILVNVALGAVSKALMSTKKSAQQSGPPPVSVTVKGTIEPRRLIFGTRRTGGVLVFYGVSSANNAYLWYVVVLAGHQVNAIKDVWIDSVKISDANIDPSTGAVTQGNFTGFLNIWRMLGTSAQTVQPQLDTDFAAWTSSHRLQGCAYVVVRMFRSETAFPTGAPAAISALVDGMRLYDPRQDSTNGGTGGHRYTDPTTWTFSHNPALVLRWYLTGGSVINDLTTPLVRYGLKEPASRIDDAYFIAAANVCDESVSGANAPPTGAQTRYLCDLEVTCGETRRVIIEAILATMAGRCVSVHGKWRAYGGDYETPVHTLTSDDLSGDMEVQDTTPHTERFNAVAAVFPDSTNDYVDRTTIYRTDSGYETKDGGERLPIEIELRGVTDQYQAQRLCEIKLRQSRMMRTIKIVGALNLLKVALHENISFSHDRYSWSSRVFRCIERQFEYNEEAGRVSLTMQQEDSAVYADILTADYTTGTSDTDQYQIDIPNAATGFIAVGTISGINFSWAIPVGSSTTVAELYEYTASTPFSSATKIWEGNASSVFITKVDTTTRYYWLQLRNPLQQKSNPTPPAASAGVPGAASIISTTLNGSVAPGSLGANVNGSGAFTTSSAVVTPSGGTPGYTYAWTWGSGGTSVTITTPTAASTTFSTTGMTSGVRSGTAVCTITDSIGGTKTVNVTVTFTFVAALSATRTPTSLSTNVANLGSSTSSSTTVTASGGTPGYTYSWAWVSGGTGISITSPTAATTSFSTTGLDSGTGVRTGTARCTVTDAAAATTTVDVTVTFTQTAKLAGTMTVGNDGTTWGFYDGLFGSMDTQAVAGGLTLVEIRDDPPSGGNECYLRLDAASNPGASFFTSITVQGATKTSASAFFSYVGTDARWTWSGTVFGIDALSTATVVVTA